MSKPTTRIWARAPFGDLAVHALPPLPRSLLYSAGDRALRRLWDDLDIPLPEEPLLSMRDGLFHLNLAAVNRAAVELLGTCQFLPWSTDTDPVRPRPSLHQLWRTRRGRRRFLGYLRHIAEEGPRVLEALRDWWRRVRSAHWSQAYLLQVMEEVEAQAARGVNMLFAAEWGLAWLGQNAAMPPFFSTDLEDVDMLMALYAAADDQRALGTFLDRYGHRAADELDLSRPRWREDDALLRAVMPLVARSGGIVQNCQYPWSVGARSPRPYQTPDTFAVCPRSGGRPQQAFSDRRPLDQRARPRGDAEWLAASLRSLRLNARAALGYVAEAIRIWALAAAQEGVADGRLRAPDDVFLLKIEELKQLLTGEWNVSRRAEIHELLERRCQAPSSSSEPSSTSDAIVGWPASAGRVTGPARVLTRLEDAARVQPGDVLVLPSADPIWGLLFPLAGGVVIEIGTPQSAAALLSQVWHVPCVVQVPGIRTVLRDGQLIAIDGASGRVSLSSG